MLGIPRNKIKKKKIPPGNYMDGSSLPHTQKKSKQSKANASYKSTRAIQ
jgi:hypothetical protein